MAAKRPYSRPHHSVNIIMMFQINITKKLRGMYENRYEPESLRALADVYWRGLLVVALVVAMCVVAYGIWSLLRILDDLGKTPDTTPRPTPVLSRSALNSTLQAFDTRSTQFDSFKKNPPAAPSDPSK